MALPILYIQREFRHTTPEKRLYQGLTLYIIESQKTLPKDIQCDYNRILKSPTYEFASTRKIRSAFSGWLNEQIGSDFEQHCKRFCEEHNSKYISVTFEELIESLLK